ncbi:MAG: nucleotidyltransferase domain-containing protein [Candidatus Aenigmarchaeota archaeon]|nr:nucleotidyltransferase domain-containing protein [Candidatus Aenigmarchaeota archaeon]
MRREIKRDIEFAINELKKIKEVKAIYLFGSQATGKAKPYSDIDICVFTKQPLSRRIKLKIFGESSKRISISLFHELPIYIQYRVLRDGKVYLVKDQGMLHDITVSTMNNYLDFKPTLDSYSEITLRNL